MAQTADNLTPAGPIIYTATSSVHHDGYEWRYGPEHPGERWVRRYCKRRGIRPFSLYEGPDGMTPIFETYSVWRFWLFDPPSTPRVIVGHRPRDDFVDDLTKRLRIVKFAVDAQARAVGEEQRRSEPNWSDSDATDEDSENWSDSDAAHE